MITLFKGDDTGGTLGKSVVVEITTEYDLSNCSVIFNYQGVERRWTGVQSGDRREVFFSHNETARMSVGTFKAVIIAVDAAGKVRTITNSLPIKVSTNLAECYGDNMAQVTIGTAVNWDSITGKPFEGQEIDIGTDDKVLAALGTIIEKLGGTVKAGIALVTLCAMSAFGYTPETHTNSFERNGVTYAQRGGLGAADYVVTNIDDSAITETDPRFREWVGGVTNQYGIIGGAESAMFAYTLGSPASEVAYSAEDITAISNGFYIGEQTLYAILTNKADKTDISAENPTFSNAVLSVGLNIDTNAVAAINALVEAGEELPIGGAATVGALLLALAAAVAALKRTKADASALRYAMPESVALVAENDAATLVCADRAVTNATIVTGFSTLNLSFPAAVSGYVRDFYLRITVAAGESAPAISVPQGITIENAGGAVPGIADGEASAAATTLVWFSETAPGVFTAKSETVKAVV